MAISSHRYTNSLIATLFLLTLPEISSCRRSSELESTFQSETQQPETELDRVYRLAHERNSDQPEIINLLEKIFLSEGFKLLDTNEQIAVLRVVSGKNNISVDFGQRITQSMYFQSEDKQQVETIREFKTPSFHLLLMSDVLNATYRLSPALRFSTVPPRFVRFLLQRHEGLWGS